MVTQGGNVTSNFIAAFTNLVRLSNYNIKCICYSKSNWNFKDKLNIEDKIIPLICASIGDWTEMFSLLRKTIG